MKKSFIKVGFMLGLALVTTVSLNSCSSEEDAAGDGTEQNDADTGDQDADNDTDKCEDGKDGEHKCEAGKCEEGKCKDGEAGEGKAAGKGVNDMTVDPEPEPKPAKEAVRGGKPKMTTDGSN